MGWFDEQLKYRQQKDEENFSDAVAGIAGAVMGRRLADAMNDREIARSAMEEILKYYHLKMKSDEIPSQLTTLEEQLEYRFRPFGILRRMGTLEKGWYKNAVGPMLGTLKEDGRAVALIPGKMGGYSYTDPKSGAKVKLNAKTEKLIDDEVVCFYQPLPLRKLKNKDLFRFLMEQFSTSDVVLFLGLAVFTTALGFLTPFFSKWLFGTVLESGSMTVLLALASFMFCFTVGQIPIFIYQGLITARINTKLNTAMQAALMGRVLSLPPRFFRNYASGDLTQRMFYVQALCASLMDSIGVMGILSIFSLAYIGQITVFAPELLVPSVLITAATIAVSLIATLWQMKVAKEQMSLASETSGMTYSMISGVQKIKLAGAERRMFSRWARQYAKEAAITYNPPTFLKISETVVLAISLIGDIILYAAAYKSGIGVSDYYAFNSTYGLVSGAFMGLSGIVTAIAQVKPTLDMIKPIMDEVPEVSEGKEVITQLRGAIELSHISFCYGDEMPNVIDDLSLRIKPGEYVAIVGSTGCGKSTLLRLLLGFETPQKGAIYYDKKDITKLDLKSLRRKIGTVTQDGKLFLGSIFSNITIASPGLSQDDAWEAAEIASIADDIRAMPMGMHTVISEGQGGISGGQRQRLMIARAIAGKPKILMFDEATSALDNVTQKKVSESIDSLKCTRIVIAHRLSTIRHCDRIIVLDKGRIIEDGTYEELIGQNGFFAKLVARQRLETEDD